MPALESAGVIVRMPASWRMNRPARLEVKGTVGKARSQVGMDALLDFRTEVTLDGETLSAAEIEWLLAQSDGLAFMRGRWIEVDRERLSRTLEQFEMSNDARSPRVCRSAKRCACWQEPALPRMGPPDTPTLTGAKPWPVPGWPRRSRPCAVPIAPLSTLVDLSGEHSGIEIRARR